jgi:hypothetical protein
MTMDEYDKRFFELLKYVDLIKDEKFKIQNILSGLPSFYSDKIQYDNPNNLEEATRREKHIYEETIGRLVFQKSWNEKMKGKIIKGRKVLSHHFSRTTTKKISKVSQPKTNTRLQSHLGKGQGSSLHNVRDVR